MFQNPGGDEESASWVGELDPEVCPFLKYLFFFRVKFQTGVSLKKNGNILGFKDSQILELIATRNSGSLPVEGLNLYLISILYIYIYILEPQTLVHSSGVLFLFIFMKGTHAGVNSITAMFLSNAFDIFVVKNLTLTNLIEENVIYEFHKISKREVERP